MAEDTPKTPEQILLDQSGEGDLAVFDKDDVTKDILDDAVEYAAQEIKDGNNAHTLKLGAEITSIRTPGGNPAALSNGNGVDEEFLENIKANGGEDAVASFNQLSDTALFDFEVQKGKSDSDALPTIGDLINDVNENLGESQIALGVEKFQQENNIFSGNEPLVNVDEYTLENESNVGHMRLQQELGKHGPRKWPDTVDSESNEILSVKKLKNLGIQILMNSSGEIPAAIPDDPGRPGDVIKAQLASTIPGAARLGVKVPLSRFSAASVARDIQPGFDKSSKFPELEQETRFSYGSPNNHLVPFHSVSNFSSRAAAMLLALTVGGMLKALSATLSPPEDMPSVKDALKGLGGDDRTPKATIRRRYLGSSIDLAAKRNQSGAGLGPISTLTSLGSGDVVNQTKNPYTSTIAAGLQVFFGTPTGAAAQLLGAINPFSEDFAPVRQNPEYFSVLLRMLVRATVEDVLGAAGAATAAFGGDAGGRAPSPMDIDRTPGLDANPTNLLNVIENLRDAKIVKFMNIISALGDIQLESIDENGESVLSRIDEVPDNLKDDLGINPAALIKRNRLSNKVHKRFEDRLAWGADTIQSMYMVPNTLINAENIWYSNPDSNNYKAIVSSDKNYVNPTGQPTNGRLPKEMVDKVETLLDSYYMPFYFQDLRTNEIIAFHAFIENISDSFNAEYTEGEGYGRVGKTYSYKNTNRQMSLSFRILSTSPEDFNAMWLKINKLVMLLYPQYTKGRQLTYGDSKFIQPFSQLIGNSPMIRLRVGDLIKSNYSEFDLGRLFGIGTEGYSLPDDTVTFENTTIDTATYESLRTASDRMSAFDFDVGDKFGLIHGEGGNHSAISPAPPGGLAGAFAGASKAAAGAVTGDLPERERLPALPPYFKVTVDEVKQSGVYVLAVEGVSGVDRITVDFDLSTSRYLDIEMDLEFLKSKTGTSKLLAAIPAASLVGIAKGFTSPKSSTNGTTSFLGASNPIFQAFDSVGGEGLAGFIKDLSFDWSDARWETESPNSRAPMWCKVDINFAPVHDISPGLDSSGAPIGLPYNVGAILKNMKLSRNQDAADTRLAEITKNKDSASIPTSKQKK